MAVFEYRALANNRRQKKGVIEADSLNQAKQQLREQGYILLNITAINSTQTKQKQSWFSARTRNKLSIDDLSLITRQLATLISASIPVAEALGTVAEQASKKRIKAILMGLRSKVSSGYALAVAMEDFPQVFSKLYRASVAAGERSGHLSAVLERLADHVEHSQANRKKMQQALIYPILMVIMSMGIVSFLMIYVVPNIIDVFSDTEQNLPTVTLILLSISEATQAYGLYVLITILSLIVICSRLVKYPALAIRVHKLLLRLPLIGRSIVLVNCSRFFHTLAMLRSAGVAVIEALQTSASLVTNIPLHQAISKATHQVSEGIGISKAFHEAKIFPPLSVHLINSGEKSGNLDKMLMRSAQYHEREVTNLIETITTLFEPFIIIVMGTIVLFIVLAVLLPIFSLDQLATLG